MKNNYIFFKHLNQQKLLAFWAFFCFISLSVFAQSPIRFSSGNYANPNSWVQGSSTVMSTIAGTNIHTTTPNGTGNQYFRFYSAGAGGTIYEPNGALDILLTQNTSSALQVTGSGKAYYLNIANAASNVVFKTNGSGTPGTSRVVAFEVQGTIQSASTVAQSPTSGSVFPGQSVTVTATLSGAFSTGQGVYLRYTSNGYATSTVVQMSGSGVTYSASIPATTNTAGANVSYYVFTSGNAGPAADGSDADLYTINLNNNGGSNYTYAVASGWTTAANGNWGTASTWTANAIPPTALDMGNVTIAHNVTLDQNAQVSKLTINALQTFTSSDGSARTLTISNPTTGTNLANSGIWANGVGASTVVFSGAATHTVSGTVGFFNVTTSTGVNFGASSTINNNFQLNTGGFASVNGPTYGASSTLIYNTGGTFTAATEWYANVTSGQGVPQNVTIGNGVNTTLSFGTSNQFRQANGDVTLSASSGLTLSSVAGGDIRFAGNFTQNGTLTNNSRALFFVGTSNKTISASSGTITLDFLVLNAGTNYLQIGATTNLVLNGNANALQFLGSTGGLDLNQRTATLNTGGTILLNAVGAKNIISTGGAGTFAFAGTSTITATSGTLIGSSTTRFTLALGLTISAANAFTVNGTLQINNGGFIAGTQAPIYGSSSTLIYNTTGTYGRGLEWSATGVGTIGTTVGYPNNVQISNNTTLNLGNGGAGTARACNGNLTIDDGSTFSTNVTAMTAACTIGGNITIGTGTSGTLTLSASAGGNLNIGGNFTKNSGTFTSNGRTITLNGTVTQTWSSNATETITTLVVSNTSFAVNLNSSITISASGSATFNATSIVNIGSSATLTMSDLSTLTTTGSTTTVNGTLRNTGATGATITSTAGTLSFSSTGNYDHNMTRSTLANLGAIPIATWNPSSICQITGLTNPTAGNWFSAGGNQTFGNFTWNTTAMTTIPNMAGATLTVGGTFTISSTNGQTIRMGAATNGTISCVNYTHTAGTLDMANGAGSGTINCSGTFNLNGGTITESGTGNNHLINFNGSSTQSITFASSPANTINYSFNNANGYTLNSTLTTNPNTTVTLTQGVFAGAGGISYNVTGTTLILGNTAGLITTSNYEWPAANGPINVTINNSGGVNLHAARTISGVLTLNSGLFSLGSNNLTISNSATGAIAGTFSNSNMIVAMNNPGQLLRATVTGTSYTYPIGETTGTTEYSPVTITFSAKSATSNIGVNVVDAVHPSINNVTSQTDYLSRYWVFSNSAAPTYTYTANFTYLLGDVNGTEANIRANVWGGASWTQAATSTASANTLSISSNETNATMSFSTTSEFTGRVKDGTTYTWNQTGTASFATATNWTPNRTTPRADDILVFNNGAAGTIATGVTTQTVAKILVSANTNISLQSGVGVALTIGGGNGTDLSVASGSTLQIASTAGNDLTLNFSNTTTTTIDGTLTIAANTAFTNALNTTNTIMNVNGILNNIGIITSTTLELLFNSGSTYNHNFTTTVGTIPTATWNANSTCAIRGYTTGGAANFAPLGLAQNFGHFTWNCPSQSNNARLTGTLTSIAGNFTVTSTGANELRLTNTQSYTLNIGGNLAISGGILNGASGNGAIANFVVSGNYNQTGGTFNFTSGSAANFTGLYCYGNFNLSVGATMTQTAATTTGGVALFEFDASISQTVTIAGTISNAIDFRLNNTAGIAITGTLPINNGATFYRTQGVPTGTIAYDATVSSLVYEVISNVSSTNSEWPTTNPPINVTMNASATVTLNASRTISGVLTETSGVLSLGSFDLNLTGTTAGALVNAAPSASNMIAAESTGQLKRAIATAGFPITYLFPIGDITGIAEYTGISINFTANNTARTLGFRTTDGRNINDSTTLLPAVDFTTRTWNSTLSTAAGTYTYTPTITYAVPGDVYGNENNMLISNWTGTTWVSRASTVTSPSITTAATVNQTTLSLDNAQILGRCPVKYWNGGSDSNWNTASNWVPSGIPVATDNIVISFINPNPCIISTGSVTINHFTITGTADFSLASGATLIVAGNLDYDAPSNMSLACGSTFSLTNTTYAQTIPAIQYGNLILGAGTRTLASTGTISICNNYTPTSGALTTTGSTVDFMGTTAQSILSNPTSFNILNISNTTATVTSATNTTVTGTMTINANARFDIGTTTLTLTGSTGNTVNGFLRSGGTAGSITGAIGTNLTFSSTGTYEHNYTNVIGTIPASTWASGSTCLIMGYTTGGGANFTPTGLNQAFHHFTWNCPNQITNDARLNANPISISGNFTITSTGTRALRLLNATTTTTNIGGNLITNGGTFSIASGAATSTINVSGDFNISSGTFDMMTGAGTATLNISGNFSQTGGTLQNTAATASINFNHPSNVQTINQTAGTITNNINWNVNGTANTAQLISSVNLGTGTGTFAVTNGTSFDAQTFTLSGSGTFNLNSGGTIITANTGGLASAGASGSIRTTTRTFNSGASYKYNNSTTAQITGNFTTTPTANTVANLIIENGVAQPAGITLTNATSVTGTLTLTNGLLLLGANNLTVSNTAAAGVSGGSSSSFVVQNGTGRFFRAIATAGLPINYIFPIGEITGTTEYSPASANFTANNTARNLAFMVTDANHPQLTVPNPQVDFLSRYWTSTLSATGGTYTFTPTFTYNVAGDVNGTEGNINLNQYNAGWTQYATTLSSPSISSSATLTQATGSLNATDWTGRIINGTYTWNGLTSSSYTTSTNWTPNIVGGPASTDNVIINVPGTNQLIITGSQTIFNFTLNGTGVLNIASGGSLTVNGNLTTGGTATANLNCNSTFNIASTLAQTVPAFTYGNLNISGGNRTLANSGTISICKDLTSTSGTITATGSTVVFNGTTAQNILTNPITLNNVTISNTASTVSSGVNVIVNGTGAVNANATFIQSSGTLTNNGTTTVNGTLKSTGGTFTNAGTLTFTSTGIYEQNMNGGSIPTATWNTGSKLNITGVTTTGPSNLSQSFYDVEWNCPLQTSAVQLSSSPFTTINNNLTFTSTGNPTAFDTRNYAGSSNGTLTIGGNLIVNGGRFGISNGGVANTGTVVVNITGDAQLNGGLFTLTGSTTFTAGTSTLNISGNMILNGGNFDFNSSNNGLSPTQVVNLLGDLTINSGEIKRSFITSSSVFRFNKATGTQTYFAATPLTATQSAGNNWEIGNGTTTPTLALTSNFRLADGTNFSVRTNGTVNCSTNIITSTTAGVFNLNSGATIISAHANGINNGGLFIGSIQTNTTNYNANANFVYNGTVNQITGNGLPNPHTGTLTIANLGNTVSLTTAGTVGSTLVLSSGSFAIGNGITYNISNNGTVTGSGGDFSSGVNGGILNFQGAGTFSGNANPYNVYTSGALDFGAGTITIQNGGTFRLNAGGSVINNAGFYATGSNLQYNSGSTPFNRGLEWSASTGRGYPSNVQISNNTTLNAAGAAAIYASQVFNTQSNIVIDAGSTLSMNDGGNDMLIPLIVGGNLTVTGTFNASGSAGGDVQLKGNLVNNGSGVNINPNSRNFTFNGTGAQTIGGSNITLNPFNFLTINNSAGVSLIAYSIRVDNQLTLTSGLVTLGNFNLSMNGLNTPISGGSTSSYILTNGTGQLIRTFDNTNTLFPVGISTNYSPVTLNQSGTTDNIGVRVKSAPAFDQTVGDASQMVNLQYYLNESVAGGNNLSTQFQWNNSPTNNEAGSFLRAGTVYHGDWTGSAFQIRTAGATAGANPYTSTATGFTGNLTNRLFVVGNLNGIMGCFSTINSGEWNDPSIWAAGIVPPANAKTCLNHAITINTLGNPSDISELNINAGGGLTLASGRTLTLVSNGIISNNSGSNTNFTNGTVVCNGIATINGTNSVSFNNLTLNGNTTITTSPTINGILQMNSGSSILTNSPTFSSTSSLSYAQTGTVSPGLEWNGNSNVAGSGIPQNVKILNSTTLAMPTSDRGCAGNMQIENGTLSLNATSGDVYVGGDWVRLLSGTFTPNNRAIIMNGTSSQTIFASSLLENFDYLVISKSSGTLNLTSNININANTGTIFNLSNGGIFDLNGNSLNFLSTGGNINCNGGTATIIGPVGSTINFSNGLKTITSTSSGTFDFGSNVKLVLNDGLNFGSNLSTINGTLQIALGGYVSTNAPIYASGSTLRYFTGNTYGRSTEWSSTSGAGYPYNVLIDPNGTPTTLDLSSGGSAIRSIAGNLSISDQASLTMNNMTNILNVAGNVTIGNGSTGSLILSSNVGGDITIGGNLTRNTAATFTQNSREVTFNGTSIQDITNVSGFDYLKIDNNGSSVRLNNATVVNNRLWLNNGTLNLNGNTITLSNLSLIRRSNSSATISGLPTITGGDAVDVQYDNSMTTSNEFINDPSKIRDLDITNGTVTLNGDRTINRNLKLGGNLDLSSFIFTDKGRVAGAGGAGDIEISSSGIKSITGLAGSRFDITGLGASTPTEYTKVVTNPGGGSLIFGSNVIVSLGDGRMNFGTGNPATVNGILRINDAGSVISNSCVYGVGSTLRFYNGFDFTVDASNLTWTSGGINSGIAGIPYHVELLNAATDLSITADKSMRGTLTITDGNLSINYGGSGSFTLGGNWNRNGASSVFSNPTNKKIIFAGSSAQNISNTGVTGSAENFYDLEISNTSGDVTAASGTALFVTNNLNFTSGKLILAGTNLLTLGTASANGSITGNNASRYLVTYSGGNTSTLKLFTNTNATYSYPIGDPTNYTPIALNLYSGGNSGSFITGSVIATAHPQLGSGQTGYLNRYWSMEQTGLTSGFTYGVDFSYAQTDVVGIESTIFPYKWTPGAGAGTGWIGAGGSNAAFQMGSGSVDITLNTMHWEGIYSFSDITGNGGGTPLPISLVNFEAKKEIKAVKLEWSTLSETNNDYFTVERTIDGVNFKEISVVDGAGNYNGILNYSTEDDSPEIGKNYYRLKQTDFNGNSEYSKLVMVEFIQDFTKSISLAPNPSNGQDVKLTINGITPNSLIQLKLFSSNGAQVFSQNANGSNGGSTILIPTENLSNGIYYIQINLDGTISNMKLVVGNN